MYAKLFTSIYQGTLRGNSHGLLVFTNLLAHCDKTGVCDMHPKAIAEEVGLSVGQVRVALDELEAPDIESRSPEEDGRRIIRLDAHRAWGWQVVNYLKYRSIRDEDDRREQNRLAQERWRNKHKLTSADVITSQPAKPESAHTEAEADTEVRQKIAAAPLPAWSPKAPKPAPVPFAGLNSDDIDPKACALLSADFELPVMWGTDALALGWTRGGILQEAERFRQYWVSGKGAGSRKSLRGWRQAWSNWLSKAEKMNGAAK